MFEKIARWYERYRARKARWREIRRVANARRDVVMEPARKIELKKKVGNAKGSVTQYNHPEKFWHPAAEKEVITQEAQELLEKANELLGRIDSEQSRNLRGDVSLLEADVRQWLRSHGFMLSD